MKIKWRYGIAFPLILALALGGLSAWLGRISEIQTEEVRLNPDEPQYWMSGIDGRRFDEQGRLKEHLSAQKAWQFPSDKNVHLGQPQLAFYQEGRLLYQVKSAEAVYNTDNRQVAFDQDVVLTKTADSMRPAGIVHADNLHIDTVSQFARTDSPVTFEYGQSKGGAGGMTYDNKKGLLNFPSRVKATIHDAKNL